MKYFLLILLVVVICSIVFFVFREKKLPTHSNTIPEPTVTTSTTPQEAECRKKIISDNGLYEDRYEKAVKTCKETQICTYEDFRMYSKANGNYVPDWRSDDYMRLEVTRCLETQPTEMITTPSSTASQSGNTTNPL